MSLGFFDINALPEGWFAPELQSAGWFDDTLITASSGGPATITGTLAATDGTDTAAFAGDIAHDGTLAATESADTAALIGDVAHVGMLATTDAADTSAFAGDIGHAGALAATDAADTFAADGAVTGSAATITGDLAAFDESDIASMEGLVATISSSPPFIGRGGGGYLVELDEKPKRETITLYDEEAEILELLAAIMPVIQEQQRRMTI